MEHCIQEGKIATLNERTQNFNRRFDEVNEKIDAGKASTDLKIDLMKEELTKVIVDAIKEKVENKWRFRIGAALSGAAGGGGTLGIIKALGAILGK